MISEEEYNEIYKQLVEMLSLKKRKDIIEAVEAQITSLDYVPSDKLTEAEDHFLRAKRIKRIEQRRQNWLQSSLFSEQGPSSLENEQSSVEVVERRMLLDYLYPPKEKVKLLLQAIEAAIPIPILIGLDSLKSLNQTEIRFEEVFSADGSFTLSYHDLAGQKQAVQDLLRDIEQIRLYIEQKG